MEVLMPYLKPLMAKNLTNTGWSDIYLREDAIRNSLTNLARKHLKEYNIQDIVSYEDVGIHLFDELVKCKGITYQDRELAGRYYRFQGINISKYFNSIFDNNSQLTIAQKTDGDYFQDVFDGYRAQHGVPRDIPLSKSTVNSITSNQLQIDHKQLSDIKLKAKSLIETIEQADLDEKVRAKALSHANAVVCLLDYENPPWKIVIDILNEPVLCAFLNSIAIIQILINNI